jgi:4-amino-4-deoxy-L-arabinose transferase-like glycosyltransferase
LSGIENHTYLWLPFTALLQAGWFKVLGYKLFSVRGFSVLWGLIELACWLYIVRKLSGNPYLALLAIALIAIDGAFLDAASEGRMDMLAASLACCAVAVYLYFREPSLPRAILLASVLATAAFLTHPVGAVGFAAIVMLYLWFDRRRFRWWHPGLVAIPLLIAAAGWGWYILQYPDDFRAQTAQLFQGRLDGTRSPWAGILREVTERYLGYYLPSYAVGFRKAKVLILVAYLAAVGACLMVPSIRKNSAWRVLSMFAPLYMLLFAIFEGAKAQYYLVYLTPPMALCLAIVSVWLWNRPGSLRWQVVALLGSVALLQISWTGGIIARRAYQRDYVPTVRFLEEHRQPSELVYGCGEWAFALGFYDHFKIDTTLGYTTGKLAKFIVWEDRCMQQAYDGYELRAPAVHKYMEDLLARQYRVVYRNDYYSVYEQGGTP